MRSNEIIRKDLLLYEVLPCKQSLYFIIHWDNIRLILELNSANYFLTNKLIF